MLLGQRGQASQVAGELGFDALEQEPHREFVLVPRDIVLGARDELVSLFSVALERVDRAAGQRLDPRQASVFVALVAEHVAHLEHGLRLGGVAGQQVNGGEVGILGIRSAELAQGCVGQSGGGIEIALASEQLDLPPGSVAVGDVAEHVLLAFVGRGPVGAEIELPEFGRRE